MSKTKKKTVIPMNDGMDTESRARQVLPNVISTLKNTLCFGEAGTARVQAAKCLIKLADLDDPVECVGGELFSAKLEARRLMPEVHRSLIDVMNGEFEMPRVAAADLLLKLARVSEAVETIPPLEFGDALAKHRADQQALEA